MVCGASKEVCKELAGVWCKKHANYTLLSPKFNQQELQSATPFLYIGGLNSDTSDTNTKEWLHLYRKSLILIIKEKHDSSEALKLHFNQHCLPFVVVMTTDVVCLVKVMEDALEGKFPNISRGDGNTLSLPFLALDTHSGSSKLRKLTVSDSHITEDFAPLSTGKTNRMVNRYGASSFLAVDFHYKMQPRDIIAFLSNGLFVDGESFHFIGCSSSGLKKRSCYMMKGTVEKVERVRDGECGQFASISSIPKKLKGIGLLFSNASPTGVEVRNDRITTVEDKMSEDGLPMDVVLLVASYINL